MRELRHVVRFGRTLGYPLAVVGVLSLVVAFLGPSVLQLVLGILLLLVGLGYLTRRPYVEIEDELVVVRSLLGVGRNFPISGLADLRLDGNLLRRVSDDRKIASFALRAADQDDVDGLWALLAGSA